MIQLAIEVVQLLIEVVCIIVQSAIKYVYNPKKQLKGTVLITGGGSGIGRLMALRFASAGCPVVLWDINQDGMNSVAEEIRRNGGTVHTHVCDVSKKENVYAVADKMKAEGHGDVTYLINNAGIVSGRPFLDCPDGLIEKTMQVNTISHFWTLKAFLPSMIAKNSGHVVTVASTAGTVGVAGLADYCASKGGAFFIDEAIRMELKKQGLTNVHTTCVCPYYINTGMFDGVKTRFNFLLPILNPDWVVDQIMNAIQTNQELLIVPRFCYVSFLCRVLLPVKVADLLAKFLGISSSMDAFKGRKQD